MYFTGNEELAEEFCYRAPVVNTADCAREEFGHRKNGHVGEAFLLRKRDGVCDDDFFDGALLRRSIAGPDKTPCVAQQ